MSLKIVISVQRFDKIKHPPCAMIGEKEQEGGGFMIEKVYSGKERENQENVRIPKNIKQIGTTTSNKKIYIEDYVINRLKKRPEKEGDIRYGVLLGMVQNSGGNSYIFIKGMIEIREVIENSIIFDDEIWSTVYQDKKKYFDKLDIVGWYISVPYRVSDDMNGIRKIHLDNFAGNNKVCFLSDRTENEDGFYLYEQTSFLKQKGYYIYYEKNEKMKKYVKSLGNQQGKEKEKQISEESKEEVLASRKNEEIKEKKIIQKSLVEAGIEGRRQGRLAYGISGMLIVALLLSTVVMLNNYGELKNIKQTLANYNLKQEAQAVNEIIDAYSGTTTTMQQNAETNAETKIMETNSEQTVPATSKQVSQNKTTVQQTQKAVASAFSGTYHTVEKGQTLYDISMKYYGNSSMVDEIKELNHIDDDYTIIDGQKILLP